MLATAFTAGGMVVECRVEELLAPDGLGEPRAAGCTEKDFLCDQRSREVGFVVREYVPAASLAAAPAWLPSEDPSTHHPAADAMDASGGVVHPPNYYAHQYSSAPVLYKEKEILPWGFRSPSRVFSTPPGRHCQLGIVVGVRQDDMLYIVHPFPRIVKPPPPAAAPLPDVVSVGTVRSALKTPAAPQRSNRSPLSPPRSLPQWRGMAGGGTAEAEDADETGSVMYVPLAKLTLCSSLSANCPSPPYRTGSLVACRRFGVFGLQDAVVVSANYDLTYGVMYTSDGHQECDLLHRDILLKSAAKADRVAVRDRVVVSEGGHRMATVIQCFRQAQMSHPGGATGGPSSPPLTSSSSPTAAQAAATTITATSGGGIVAAGGTYRIVIDDRPGQVALVADEHIIAVRAPVLDSVGAPAALIRMFLSIGPGLRGKVRWGDVRHLYEARAGGEMPLEAARLTAVYARLVSLTAVTAEETRRHHEMRQRRRGGSFSLAPAPSHGVSTSSSAIVGKAITEDYDIELGFTDFMLVHCRLEGAAV